MKKYILSILFNTAFMCSITSCDTFVDVDLPDSQLTAVAVFESNATATAALAALYANIRSSGVLTGNPSGLSNQLGHYADELIYFGDPFEETASFYSNTLLASGTATASLWANSYSEIYQANALIKGVAGSSGLTASEKAQLTGEALFLRALLHFYLVNLYGAVPYVTTTDYNQNSKVVRMSEADVYQQIRADLESAIVLLPEGYLSLDRTRPNKYVAQALLARVYLYSGAYAEAANAASAVINNSALYGLESDLNRTFLRESHSTLWQFASRNPGINTDEAGVFIFLEGPPPFTALNENLVSSFENGDLRLSHWVGTVSDGTTTWYYANKYKETSNTGDTAELSVVFRLSELYLLRAEARARQGELSASIGDLNSIRNLAGLSDTDATSQGSILTALLRERRVELFTEYGHRFFDLRRFGLLDAVLSTSKLGWDPTDVFLPLPDVELSLNPNLNPQNNGY